MGYETYQQHVGATDNFSADIANASSYSLFEVMDKGSIVNASPGTVEVKDKNKGKEKKLNPFEGSVEEDVIVVDPQGNAIPVSDGNWLTGSKDGKWIQEMAPNGIEGSPTGLRKDGGHPRGPKHPDPRGWKPHGHVPNINNPDGTPWMPIH